MQPATAILLSFSQMMDEGRAERGAASCGKDKLISDSEEYWANASPEQRTYIECGSRTTHIGVGFSLHEDGRTRRLGLVTAALTVASSAVSRIGRSPALAPNSCSIRLERSS